MIKTSNILIAGVCVVAATAILISWSQSTTSTQTGTATVRIDSTHDFNYQFSSDATALDALRAQDTKDPAMHLATKSYPGLGELVDSMYGMTNGDGDRYWQYDVNGVRAAVGASTYVLKHGDRIEWSFSSYEGE